MRVRKKKGAGATGEGYVFDGRGRASGHEMKSPGAGEGGRSPSGPLGVSRIHADGSLPNLARRLSPSIPPHNTPT